MDLQKLLGALSEAGRRSRKDYHLTLGGAIEKAAAIDGSLPVSFSDTGNAPCSPHSYRGYYSDLAFDADVEPATVADFLADCRASIGQTFEGYKGGDFLMEEDTPLWASPYGYNSGRAITDLIVVGDKAVLVIKQV